MKYHLAVMDEDHNCIGVIVADAQVNERLSELLLSHYIAREVRHGVVNVEDAFNSDAIFIKSVMIYDDEEVYSEQLRLQVVPIF